ncbi:hypothetical protein [Stieleria varia]|uniref:Uncharacterized protein n=1 Tax=Stieleria varia TaxID=2528005 RepID=A0A5C6AGL8_9BACT|nr:hypothetical protein [Stieleria varia]TWT98546.1 hypothetical protein Pla52n_50620 [Stieleria varia]
MAKKLWMTEHATFLDQIFDLLKGYEDVVSVEQEPYKQDFFRVFSEAYRAGYCWPSYRVDEERDRLVQSKVQRPMIFGDTIWEHARALGLIDADSTARNSKMYFHLTSLTVWWDEWTYAWNRNPPPRRYRRKHPDNVSGEP